jgi:hypothetical protein
LQDHNPNNEIEKDETTMKKTMKLLLGLSAFGTFACAGTGDYGDEDLEPRSGLQVSTKVQASDLVRGFEYQVTRVACEGERKFEAATYSATIGLEDLMLPGGIPAFEKEPLDPDSEHMFADHYFVLPAGCYDVEAIPLNRRGRPSDVCYSAHQDGVEVEDGLTTEILLISQCIGPARGGLDVVTVLNNPPVVEDLEYEPSKFVGDCEGVEICMTASDPDHDPLEFVWEQISGTDVRGPRVTSTDLLSNGSIRQCAHIGPRDKSKTEFKVTVYDLAWDDEGNLTRIEDLLAEQGDAHDSHDDLIFPLYSAVECPRNKPKKPHHGDW